jgi:hypothetical protein
MIDHSTNVQNLNDSNRSCLSRDSTRPHSYLALLAIHPQSRSSSYLSLPGHNLNGPVLFIHNSLLDLALAGSD